MFKTIQPAPVHRGQDGSWVHPEFFKPADGSEIPKAGEFGIWLEQQRVIYAEIWMDGDPEADLLTKAQDAGDLDSWKRWSPSAPDGDGWFMVAIYEEEDGPVSLWLQPVELDPSALAAMINRHHAEAILENQRRE